YYCQLIIIILMSHFAGGQNSGIYESYLIIDTNLNPASNEFFDLQATTGNPDFIGTNLGTYINGDSFVLRGAQIKTFKCISDDILNGQIYYRIYEQSASAPAFSNTVSGNTTYLGWKSDDGTGP